MNSDIYDNRRIGENIPIKPPSQRIVCLSAEAADWFWRIGAWDSVVGVTAYFSQPPDASPRPVVSGFSSASLEKITQLRPDLVVTFSDVQAQLSGELMREGLAVLATNQRTLSETAATLELLARVVGREAEADPWLRKFRAGLAPVEPKLRRSRVYFEEWDEPFISGIAWVSELIERAGGEDVFAELRTKRAAPDRLVSAEQILRADPEIIFASWCGKPFRRAAISTRLNWGGVSAVRNGSIHEIPSEDILQPGFRLVYGYERIKQLLRP